VDDGPRLKWDKELQCFQCLKCDSPLEMYFTSDGERLCARCLEDPFEFNEFDVYKKCPYCDCRLAWALDITLDGKPVCGPCGADLTDHFAARTARSLDLLAQLRELALDEPSVDD
jgi:hypothetical protein